jgi:penicillin amidase
MLKVQLDDRALFLARWRNVALQVLTDEAVGGNAGRRQFRTLLADSWTSHASINSVGYRLVRSFRVKTAELALAPIVDPVRRTRGALPLAVEEGPLWALISLRPQHLLDRKYASWDELLLASIDGVVDDLTKDGKKLADRSWGGRNTVQVHHAISRALPFASRWLDMPVEQLPGDNNMPRVQGPEFGASERLAVSPGRESEGYFHMPGGQSGHPLSPNYRDGHSAWAHGEPTPFLPGPAVHRLRLLP